MNYRTRATAQLSLFFLLFAGFFTGLAQAKIERCVTADGEVLFTNTRCPSLQPKPRFDRIEVEAGIDAISIDEQPAPARRTIRFCHSGDGKYFRC